MALLALILYIYTRTYVSLDRSFLQELRMRILLSMCMCVHTYICTCTCTVYMYLHEFAYVYTHNANAVSSFNARVGRSAQIDDVVGMFGENTWNVSGNRLLSFLNEVELMICNVRKLVSEPEWTRIRPSLKQNSIIDYIITDASSLKC